jgi:hypothetical protein
MIYPCPFLEISLVSESDGVFQYFNGGVPEVVETSSVTVLGSCGAV